MVKLVFTKIYGGKSYLAKWIISHFPEGYEQMTYIEPCLGGGNIYLQMNKPAAAILNDKHWPTYCMFRALLDNQLYPLVRNLEYSQETFDTYKNAQPLTYIQYGVREYVLHRMSRGGMKKDFAWSNRLRGGQPGDVNAWHNAVANLPAIKEKFSGVTLLNDDAFLLIEQYKNRPDVFIYIDPPYLADTRTSKSVYDLEFDRGDHERLLDLLLSCQCKWLLSGYESDLYLTKLGNPKATKSSVLASSQAKVKKRKTEALWCNYA
jgi:DNA adenine methylase